MNAVDEVFELMERRGGDAYLGEEVSQLQHALQAAHFAKESGGNATMVAAALLHDVGHLLHKNGEGAASQGIDTHHEDEGYRWLLARFGQAVAEPVRLHVAAKRYLCATEPGYYEALSFASKQSLALQGGAFSGSDLADFDASPRGADALQLRHWDDAAKVVDLQVPGLESYRELLEPLATVIE